MPHRLHTSGGPIHNRLLASLPEAEFQRLQPHLERVALKEHQKLMTPGTRTEYIYFLESGLVSMILTLEDGATIEIGLIGDEGLVGILPALGASSVASEAIVQIAGAGLRIRTAVLRGEVGLNPPLREALVRFLEALFVQITQTVACNGHHTVRQRLARWLLMAADRGNTDVITLSHEFLAMMLGVRRPSVTIALAVFKNTGLVATGRGRIIIKNRKALERAACECYSTVKMEYDRLLNYA